MNFWKYQGAGNDFIMVDQRAHQWITRADQLWIEKLCNRRFGIGGDGLILLQNKPEYDFEMIYFNADGRESTMCGNGGRCIAAFAKHLHITNDTCKFWAIDGPHEARLTTQHIRDQHPVEWVELKMSDVRQVEKTANAYILNTGSPHYVQFVAQLEGFDLVEKARNIRYSDRFAKDGINVNFIQTNFAAPDTLSIRTYERGVEDETLACGTGVTAAAIASFLQNGQKNAQGNVTVHARGGDLSVTFRAHADGSFTDIWLHGPAEPVFAGKI